MKVLPSFGQSPSHQKFGLRATISGLISVSYFGLAAIAVASPKPMSHLSLQLTNSDQNGGAVVTYQADTILSGTAGAQVTFSSPDTSVVPLDPARPVSLAPSPVVGSIAIEVPNEDRALLNARLVLGDSTLAFASLYLQRKAGTVSVVTEPLFYESVSQTSNSDDETAARRFVADIQRQYPGEQIDVPAYGSAFPPYIDAHGNAHPISTTGALSRLFGSLSAPTATGGSSPTAPDCLPTPDYSFNVYGNVEYYNDSTQSLGIVALTTVQPHTYVGERDEYCKLTLYEIVWQATTTSNGYYNLAVESYYANTNNPIVAFAAIPANAGHYKTSSCISGTVYYEDSWPQTLTRTALTQNPVGADVQITPLYTSSNSLAWLFFWETRLDAVQQAWAAAGFNTFFNAGYDPNVSTVAEFDHNDNGNGCASSVIRFGTVYKWDGWTVDHEAGHYWQYQKQSKSLPGNTVHDHSLCTGYDATTAFIEGVADWHGNQFSSQSERAGYGFGTYGAEVSENVTCDTTHYAEAGVADFIWDYFDSVNNATYDGSLDTLSFGSPLPYLKTNWPGTETSFSGWYNDMLSQGKFGSQAAAVLTLANHFVLF